MPFEYDSKKQQPKGFSLASVKTNPMVKTFGRRVAKSGRGSVSKGESIFSPPKTKQNSPRLRVTSKV